MDKTWYSKATHFKLDCHLPAYIDEILTVKSWSDAAKNQINCQILREDDCLSTFSITYNPDLKFVPKLLPLTLDVIGSDKDIISLEFNVNQIMHFRDRFNRFDFLKFLNVFIEHSATALRYGLWGVPQLIAGTKGSMVAVYNFCNYHPMIYTMKHNARLRYLLKLSSIGDTSYSPLCILIDCDTETVVHESKWYVVFMVDEKIAVLPDSFKDKLLEHVPKKQLNDKVIFYYCICVNSN